MKKAIQGLKKENPASLLLGGLSQTPARDLENAFPWAAENSDQSAFCKGAPTYLTG